LDVSNGASVEGAAELRQLQTKVAQLQQALESRIVVEQAKGAVSARCDVPVDVAFEMIRGMARSRRRKLHELCAELVENGGRFAVDPRTTTL
jgi:AmiR/NasT family two-component response regulator